MVSGGMAWPWSPASWTCSLPFLPLHPHSVPLPGTPPHELLFLYVPGDCSPADPPPQPRNDIAVSSLGLSLHLARCSPPSVQPTPPRPHLAWHRAGPETPGVLLEKHLYKVTF